MIHVAVCGIFSKPSAERYYRTLPKANLEKLYVHATGEWYPAQQSRAWFVHELEPLIATQYPELLPQDAFDPESQSGSPTSLSQAGGVTEGESFSVGDGENLQAENANVSMIDRSMDDAVA